MIRSFAGVALLAGCPGQSKADSPVPTPAGVEVRDAAGEITARVVFGRPCRALVEGVDLQVGAKPLVAMVGNVRWDGADGTKGTAINRNGVRVAGIVYVDSKVLVHDDQGIPVISARVDGESAPVLDAANTNVRTATRSGSNVTIGDMTVSGTQDLLLAALLTAHEIGPEVRALAACHRLLLLQKSAP